MKSRAQSAPTFSLSVPKIIPESLLECLAGSSLGSGVGDTDLEEIANYLLIRRLQAGDIVMREGSVGRTIVVIIHGSLSIYSESMETEVALLGPGNVVGEIGGLLEVARTMTVRAKTIATIGILSHKNLYDLLQRIPSLGQSLFDLAKSRLDEDEVRETRLQQACPTRKNKFKNQFKYLFGSKDWQYIDHGHYIAKADKTVLLLSDKDFPLKIFVLEGQVVLQHMFWENARRNVEYKTGDAFVIEPGRACVKSVDGPASIMYVCVPLVAKATIPVDTFNLSFESKDSFEAAKQQDPRLAQAVAGINRRASLAVWSVGGIPKPAAAANQGKRSSLGQSILPEGKGLIDFLELFGIPAKDSKRKILPVGDYSVVSFEPVHQYLEDEPLLFILEKFGKSIKSLNLSDCWSVTDFGLSEALQHCPNLSSLNLSNCWAISEAGFKEIFKKCKTLSGLEASNCPGLTDEALSLLGNGLEQLNISFCKNISGDVWEIICKSSRTLQFLSLKRCMGISDEGILSNQVNADFPLMRQLDLSDCSLLSNGAILKLIRMMPNLKTLNLEFCQDLDKYFFSQLVEVNKSIEDLTLNYCTNSIDDHVIQALSGWLQLKRLSVVGCTALTTKCLSALSDLPELDYLNMNGCPKVNANTLALTALRQKWTIELQGDPFDLSSG